MAIALLAAGAEGGASFNFKSSGIVIQEILVDGQSRTLRGKQPPSSKRGAEAGREAAVMDGVRISSRAQRVAFRFGPDPTSLHKPVRLRYQLEGLDKDWREAGGEMRLNVRFLDQANSTVGAQDFLAKGESVGWSGTVARSRFTGRREELKALPIDADSATFYCPAKPSGWPFGNNAGRTAIEKPSKETL